MDALFHKTAHDLCRKIAARRIGVAELIVLYLHRIEAYQPGSTPWPKSMKPCLLRRALDNQQNDRNLPLCGLPVLIKDNIDMRGLHTTAGSVAHLRQRGTIILGETNMTEFANYAADAQTAEFAGASVEFSDSSLAIADGVLHLGYTCHRRAIAYWNTRIDRRANFHPFLRESLAFAAIVCYNTFC